MQITVRGIPQTVADEVRRTRSAPEYGHPIHVELATGTGPCRCCLRPFAPGVDQRLLFTYRPAGDGTSLMAPGPVFIHAEHCDAYDGEDFPDLLRGLPLAFEARAAGGRVIDLCTQQGIPAEQRLRPLFALPRVQWVQVRHAVAGCYIASVEKKAPRSPAGPE